MTPLGEIASAPGLRSPLPTPARGRGRGVLDPGGVSARMDRDRGICYRSVSSMSRIRLHSLRLTGFKSFVDEVELGFPGDVSAIIGPNGCGKSNLVDAMLWVMGEQSPSLMRLRSMGDVVFSGAAGRQPAAAAEVSLRLRADDGRWEATGGQMEVSRRVLRSGPSEYRVDGRSARLKDVSDRLLGVGLGTRDYSVIEQGRVGQVLSARPTDRRVLLEEAAGITRYKVRRREAELKLEHTRQNLLRLDDVIAEVERALRQLRRQARQAERHAELESELKTVLRELHALDAAVLEARRQQLARRRGEGQNESAAAASALAGAEADLAEARAALEVQREEVEAARAEVSERLAASERLGSFLERSADLIESLRSGLAATRREAAGGSERSAGLDAEHRESEERLRRAAAARTEVAAELDRARSALESARAVLEQAERDSGRLREELLRVISALTSGRNRLRDLEREQDRLAWAVTQLGQERERLAARRADADLRLSAAAEEARSAGERVAGLEAARGRTGEQRAALAAESAELRRRADGLSHREWELRHRLTGVEREIARHAAVVEQVAEVLPEEAVLGVVSSFLHPAPAAAADLDRVWYEWLGLPVVRAEALEKRPEAGVWELEGRLRLAVAGAAPAPLRPPVPAGAQDLLEVAGVDDEQLGWLTRVLPPAYRVGDHAAARRLADAHPDAVVLEPDGTLHRGRTVELPTTAAAGRGALELAQERVRLETELAGAAGEVAGCAARREQVDRRLAELDAELAEAARALVMAEQARAGAAAAEDALGTELGRLERELEAVERELERSRGATGDTARRRQELEGEVARLEARSEELEREVEAAGGTVEERRHRAGEALRVVDRWRADERLAAEREGTARTERDRLVAERAALEQRLSNLSADEARLVRELAETEDESVRSRARLVEEQGMLAAARERERRVRESVEQAAQKVARLETEVRGRRSRHEQAREVLHAVEVELTRVEAERSRLAEVAAADVGMSLAELASVEAAEGREREPLKARVERLRRELEGLGPVNLLALREVEELDGRARFLRAQRKDLVGSLEVLQETVREIDATCTERFVATFQRVNEVFVETFRQLFGGGAARLDLVDEDNPLESGIDITAQPPGKRNQSVQLLSGGEKALTALALLISLFRIRPSPVCILDEVDAPLDDANVERLLDLVRAMTEHTQFVLITHNRRTMSRADVLYGVTMEEPGVSKVVSVRIED